MKTLEILAEIFKASMQSDSNNIDPSFLRGLYDESIDNIPEEDADAKEIKKAAGKILASCGYSADSQCPIAIKTFINTALANYIKNDIGCGAIVKHIFTINPHWQSIIMDYESSWWYDMPFDVPFDLPFNNSCDPHSNAAFDYFCTLPAAKDSVTQSSLCATFGLKTSTPEKKTESIVVLERLRKLQALFPDAIQKIKDSNYFGFICDFIEGNDRFSDPFAILDYLVTTYEGLCKKNYLGIMACIRDEWPDATQFMLDHAAYKDMLFSPCLIPETGELCIPVEVILSMADDDSEDAETVRNLIAKMDPSAAVRTESEFDDITALYKQQREAEEEILLKEFAYLKSAEIDMTELMQEITQIHEMFTWVQNDKLGPKKIATPMTEVKFASQSEGLDYIKFMPKDSLDLYFSIKDKPLSLFVVQSMHIPELLREKTANYNANFSPASNFRAKTQAQNLEPLNKFPDSASALIEQGHARDLRNSEDYQFLVHVFSTDIELLESWSLYLKQGLPGFMQHAPFFSASVINPATSYANMSHQGNQLPPMALVIEACNGSIVCANGSDIFSDTEFQGNEQNVLNKMLELLEKRKIVELTRAAVIKHVLKQEPKHIKLFEENWDLIVSHYFPNLILPFDETFGNEVLAQPQISPEKVLAKTTSDYYNEVVIRGNGMSVEMAPIHVSAILVQEDELNAFLTKMTSRPDDKQKQQLLANFNQVLALGLPLVVIKSDPLRNLRKGSPPTEKEANVLAKIKRKLDAKTTGLYFALQHVRKTPEADKAVKELVAQFKREVGKAEAKLKGARKIVVGGLKAGL